MQLKVFICTQGLSKAFQSTQLKFQTKVQKVTIGDHLFADDTAMDAHTKNHLQNLMNHFSLKIYAP